MNWVNKQHIVKVWLQPAGVDFQGSFQDRYVITLIDGSVVTLDVHNIVGPPQGWPEFIQIDATN